MGNAQVGPQQGKARKVYAETDEDDESWLQPDEVEMKEEAPKTLVDKIFGVREHRNRRQDLQKRRHSVHDDAGGEFGGLEFLVKWSERALIHTEWVPSAMIEADGTQSMLKMRRFLRDHPNMLSNGEVGVEYFDPIMTEVIACSRRKTKNCNLNEKECPNLMSMRRLRFWDETGEWVKGRVALTWCEDSISTALNMMTKASMSGFLRYMTDSWRYCVTGGSC